MTQHDLLIGGASNAITSVAPSSTTGIPVISQGTSTNPIFGTAVVAGGGTGNVTLTPYQIMTGGVGTTSAMQQVAGVGTSGQILMSQGASALPIWANAPSSIAFVNVTGTTQAMAVNTNYMANNASLVTFTLPASATIGQTVSVVGSGAGKWTIVQNSGQIIHFGSVNTTTTTGSLTATNQYDTIELQCNITNTNWVCTGKVQGNITVV